jgi:hypothetical protein
MPVSSTATTTPSPVRLADRANQLHRHRRRHRDDAGVARQPGKLVALERFDLGAQPGAQGCGGRRGSRSERVAGDTGPAFQDNVIRFHGASPSRVAADWTGDRRTSSQSDRHSQGRFMSKLHQLD